MTTHTIGLREEWLAVAAVGAADCLCLGAAPTFAIMALVAGFLGGGSQDMSCAAMQYTSSLSGMVPMYLLMSAAVVEADCQPAKSCPQVLISRRPNT